MRNLYDILGVSKTATSEEIQVARRKLSRELHPDINGNKAAEEQLKEINAAYSILSKAEKRKEYDRISNQTFQNSEGYTNNYQNRYRETYKPQDINEQFEQMFRQTYGMSWEEMMGGKPNTADTTKKDEEKRQNEATEQARIKRDADELARELEQRRRDREEETRQKDEFNARVDRAWQDKLANLSFGEKAKRMTSPNWDFREHSALRQKMEREEKSKHSEDIKDEISQRQKDIKKETFEREFKEPEMKPITGWKPGHEPEISDRRKFNFNESGLSPDTHTVGRKPPKEFNPSGESKG